MTDPFAQAFAELREVIAHGGVIDRREALARWKHRWIDRADVVSSQSAEVTDSPGLEDKLTAQALRALADLVPDRPGVVGKSSQALPFGVGGVEHRLSLCVVRAEPKE